MEEEEEEGMASGRVGTYAHMTCIRMHTYAVEEEDEDEEEEEEEEEAEAEEAEARDYNTRIQAAGAVSFSQ